VRQLFNIPRKIDKAPHRVTVCFPLLLEPLLTSLQVVKNSVHYEYSLVLKVLHDFLNTGE
jgi:hypothetical protein